jgi:hypothetical protein
MQLPGQGQGNGRLQVQLKSNVLRIEPGEVLLELESGQNTLPNGAAIISAGGVLPIDLLKKIGIEFESKHGTVWRVFNPHAAGLLDACVIGLGGKAIRHQRRRVVGQCAAKVAASVSSGLISNFQER